MNVERIKRFKKLRNESILYVLDDVQNYWPTKLDLIFCEGHIFSCLVNNV